MALSVLQKINIANASCIYTSNELKNGKVHGGYLDKNWPTLIYMVRQALEWLNDLDPTHEDLDTIGNYLIAICKHQGKAQANLVDGGNLPTISGPSYVLPEVIDFTVNGSSSTMITGDTVLSIPSFAGYNVELTRGGLVQFTTEPEDGSTYYSWNRTTYTLILLNGAAQLGEQIRIVPIPRS
jgi:hypothetical protein